MVAEKKARYASFAAAVMASSSVAVFIFIVLLLVGLAFVAQLQLPYEQVLNTQDKFYLFFIFFAFSSIRVTYGTKNNYLKPLSKAEHTVHRAKPCGKLAFYP